MAVPIRDDLQHFHRSSGGCHALRRIRQLVHRLDEDMLRRQDGQHRQGCRNKQQDADNMGQKIPFGLYRRIHGQHHRHISVASPGLVPDRDHGIQPLCFAVLLAYRCNILPCQQLGIQLSEAIVCIGLKLSQRQRTRAPIRVVDVIKSILRRLSIPTTGVFRFFPSCCALDPAFSPVTRNIRQKCNTVSCTPGNRKPRRFSPTSGRPVPAGRPDPRCCRKSCNRTAPASSTPPAAASRGWPRRSAGTGCCSCCCRTA